MKKSEQQLKRSDKKTFGERLRRLEAISSHKIEYIMLPAERVENFAQEAQNTFVSGDFRSCIFCCASAADQAFKDHYVNFSGYPDPEELQWEIEISKMTFGKIIDKMKSRFNIELIKIAQDLNDLRNTISVHPIFLAVPQDYAENEYNLVWANKTLIRDIRKILSFLTIKDQEKFMVEEIRLADEKGKVRKKIKFSEVLSNPSEAEGLVGFRVLWEERLLEYLALTAYGLLAMLLNELYMPKTSKSAHKIH